MVFAVGILSISVLFLIVSVLLLAWELNATKKAQRAAISLQLYQQLATPPLARALESLRSGPSMNGHRPDEAKNVLAHGQQQAYADIHRYFAYVGELVRRGVADEEVFAVMGPTISEAWHSMRDYRHELNGKYVVDGQDDFDWLYVEWLNWDHNRRTERESQSVPELSSHSR
jgi:hypothetical protein